MNNQNVHPIHILYSVIALAIVVWSVLYYQVKNAPEAYVPQETAPPLQTELSEAEKINLQARLDTEFPPENLTETEKKALAGNLEQQEPTRPLTDEEKKVLEDNLNNN